LTPPLLDLMITNLKRRRKKKWTTSWKLHGTWREDSQLSGVRNAKEKRILIVVFHSNPNRLLSTLYILHKKWDFQWIVGTKLLLIERYKILQLSWNNFLTCAISKKKKNLKLNKIKIRKQTWVKLLRLLIKVEIIYQRQGIPEMILCLTSTKLVRKRLRKMTGCLGMNTQKQET